MVVLGGPVLLVRDDGFLDTALGDLETTPFAARMVQSELVGSSSTLGICL